MKERGERYLMSFDVLALGRVGLEWIDPQLGILG
jgi:hypothetical protein